MKNVQWQGQLMGTRGLVLIPHPKTHTLTHLSSLLFGSGFAPRSRLSGRELGSWSKVRCLRNKILFEQSRSHRQYLGKVNEITTRCATWATAVPRLVQTDWGCAVLWRDWATETLFVSSKLFVIHIKTEGKDAEHKREMCFWCVTKGVFFISLKQTSGHLTDNRDDSRKTFQ